MRPWAIAMRLGRQKGGVRAWFGLGRRTEIAVAVLMEKKERGYPKKS